MKRTLFNLSRRYQDGLRAHLEKGRRTGLELARGIGSEALAAGMQMLDVATLHEQTLVCELLPDCPANKRAALIKQAGIFLAVVIGPIEETQRSARDASLHLKKIVETLSLRTVQLAASNLELSREITQRKAVEKELRKSERQHAQSLQNSNRQQEQFRRMSRQILLAQEDERKRISRELHDVIAQTLTGINIRLAALKNEAALNIQGLELNIARTQQLVAESVNIVHEFARELRPAALDDLGLIPALHSFLKGFTTRTGVRAHLTAFAGVEQLDMAVRTALFRVAQEALTNVARHAQASRLDINIQKLSDCICMKIKDNGKSFNVGHVMRANRGNRLGLLGMRERVEMVGGKFSVESTPDNGTTIEARIPLVKVRASRQPFNEIA